MKPWWARPWIPWAIFLTSLGLIGVSVLLALDAASYRAPIDRLTLLDVVWALSIMVLPGAGALIASRRPAQPIGWLLTAMGICLGLGLFSSEYVWHSEAVPGPPLPLVGPIAWFSTWPFVVTFGAPFFLLLLFPTGHLPSPRWRWLAWSGGSALAINGVCEAFSTRPIEIGNGGPGVPNPLGIETLGDFLETSASISLSVFLVALVGAAVAPIARYRREHGEQRQQIKWFAGAAITFVVASAFQAGVETWGDFSQATGELITTLTFVTVMSATAGAIVISLLKYRLYDIDVVVNRTLVYSSLTVLLGTTYWLCTLLLQGLVAVGAESDVAVAASTLAVAALFRPLRARIQGAIDRRFYRSRYDAARALADFNSRLRDEVGLDSLTDDLLAVVQQTVQPAHARVWLRAVRVP